MRLLRAAAIALALLAASTVTAFAHPLGNYTVNRAMVVTIGAERIGLVYLIDMAEIPAFNEIAAVDVDGDGSRSAAEVAAYADRACGLASGGVALTLDGRRVPLMTDGTPALSFPQGAGGLHTLRLECHFGAPRGGASSGSIAIDDTNDDGHIGWHEVVIQAADSVRLTRSDSPSTSDSSFLTAYPADRLQTPPDVRRGSASFVLGGGNGAVPQAPGSPTVAQTAADPLAALVGGQLSPALVAVALLLAAALGAAHALSPGHGKTLVAAYLVGSRGTVRQAAALGLTVAATHTAGVLVLGVLVLLGGELFLPERVIGWLTVFSGGVMAALGAALIWRAIRRPAHRTSHSHPHAHPHAHPHLHPHAPDEAGPALTVRSIALLGMAGGMVPSASALIVLLAAITTGRLVLGLALIVAFGVGMAVVLGGIAAATTLAQGWLRRRSDRALPSLAQRLAGVVPIGSGIVVAGFGVILTLTAAARLG
jgi:ABC-type nickel/cobalt efflux system permease component RcnA